MCTLIESTLPLRCRSLNVLNAAFDALSVMPSLWVLMEEILLLSMRALGLLLPTGVRVLPVELLLGHVLRLLMGHVLAVLGHVLRLLLGLRVLQELQIVLDSEHVLMLLPPVLRLAPVPLAAAPGEPERSAGAPEVDPDLSST